MHMDKSKDEENNSLAFFLFFDETAGETNLEAVELCIKESVKEIHFFKINCYLHPSLSQSFRIKDFPQLVVTWKGKEVYRLAEKLSQEKVKAMLKLLKKEGYC